MERHYRFAGVELTVSMPRDICYPEGSRLDAFEVATVTDPHVFRFEIVDTLTPPAGECIVSEPAFRIYRDGNRRIRCIGSMQNGVEGAYIRASHQGRQHHVQVLTDRTAGCLGAKTILNAIEAEHLVARAGGFVFHCAYIDWKGNAILFTAPSGTGKSTQADLWNRLRGAGIVNGDRAAVRIVDGDAIAAGIPFAGSSCHCLNRSLPVAAVVYLAQAPVTSIRRIRGYEAFARIWEGVSVNTWDRTDVDLVSDAVRKLAESVPVFHLPCTPDESAVNALEQALKEQVML